jgi:hypothetical protein
MVRTDGTMGKHRVGCSKRPAFSPAQPRRAETRLVPSKAAALRLTSFHVLPFTVFESEARTPLADLFSILQDGGFRKWQTRSSAPDDAFLIEEVIDDFDAIAHLDLCLF